MEFLSRRPARLLDCRPIPLAVVMGGTRPEPFKSLAHLNMHLTLAAIRRCVPRMDKHFSSSRWLAKGLNACNWQGVHDAKTA